MASNLLDGLNENQKRAVTSTAPVILCLAGAGSGKTTVLTRHIANLNINHRVGTTNMLALTFTRLAGKEMKERVIKLIGEEDGRKLFCNTFHAFAVSVLRRWGHKLGIDDNFTIYDQEDREEILKRIIDEFGGRTSLKKVMGRHETCGDYRIEQRLYPEECKVLMEYGHRCKQNNAVDLDRLIDLVIRLWEICPEALEEYQRNFTHVFVDEFQDTNDEQMRMLQLLNPPNFFVVGDDFQAIYGWRKARVEYILNFPNEYPGCEVIKLEDNYRSTEQIVAVANRLIKHNVNQTDKKLIAHKTGIEVVNFTAPDSHSEATNIAELVKTLNGTNGVSFKEIAILARTNNQIDNILEVLERANIPAQRVGGRDDPFNSPLVRSILNWMYFFYNRRDNIAIKKCLRLHGITLLQSNELEFAALTNDVSIWDAMLNRKNEPFCRQFIDIVEAIDARLNAENIYKPIQCFQVIDELLRMNKYFQSPAVAKAQAYILSWEESKRFLGESDSVQAFLKFMRYRDIQEKLIEEKDAVKPMTVHASKGLEFDSVIVAGMNQDIFPSRKGDIEEERRLCYVALTRAKNRLYLTRSDSVPDWRGSPMMAKSSQFLNEIGI